MAVEARSCSSVAADRRSCATAACGSAREGMVSRNVDLLNAFVVPQQSFNFGINGEIARNTVIGINVNADRLASPVAAEASWVSRFQPAGHPQFPDRLRADADVHPGADGTPQRHRNDRGHGVQRLECERPA